MNEQDMNVPVTRGEMHQALEAWAKVIIDRIIDTVTANMTANMAALEARITAKTDGLIAASETRIKTELSADIGRATAASTEHLRLEFRADISAAELRLTHEIGRATSASAEQLRGELRSDIAQHVEVVVDKTRTELNGVDDQYKSLPGRVERLEDAVFKPKSKRRAKG